MISTFFLQLEIKNHVFFSPINWDDLYHKRLTPPFNPNVVRGHCVPYSGFLGLVGEIWATLYRWSNQGPHGKLEAKWGLDPRSPDCQSGSV